MASMAEADGVYVLDTGSTDGTAERLRALGAVVVEERVEPWRFDTARNRSLELVPEDADICVCTAYGSHPVRRAAGRVGGVLGGSLLFCLLYQLCPPALHGGLGILSGLCLGLCASYGFCTVFNCLGALLTASALFGPGPAAAIRVCNNVLGSLFGLFFALVWPWLLDALSRRRTAAARES